MTKTITNVPTTNLDLLITDIVFAGTLLSDITLRPEGGGLFTVTYLAP